MYQVAVEIRDSAIDGKGVFSKKDIQKNVIVWQYSTGHDIRMSKHAFDTLDPRTKARLSRVTYLSPTTDQWVMPPEGNPACFTNHNPAHHNISVVFEAEVSYEPFFLANRDIKAGEEITNNYLEFDKNTKVEKYNWLKP
jgi:hypothetical protein